MVNVYNVILKKNGSFITVDDIYLEANEGDFNHAIHLAIDVLRNSGMNGTIEYVSHTCNNNC